MSHFRLTLLALSMLLPTAVRAQDHPLFLPSHAAAVIYRIAGGDMGNGAQKVRVTYEAGGQRERVDYFRWVEAKYPFATLIVDRPADKLIVINGEAKIFAKSNIGKFMTPETQFSSPGMRYTRIGTAEVASENCTDWQLQPLDKNAPGGTVCVTDDGLILRYVRAGISTPVMAAIAVSRGPAPDGIFSEPSGFKQRPMPFEQ